jgi:hypothetical protein
MMLLPQAGDRMPVTERRSGDLAKLRALARREPHVNTGTMSDFIGMLAEAIDEGDHAIVVMDQAGWHGSGPREVPACVTILPLPPFSPELNPIERLFGHLRSHDLSNRAYDDCRHLLDAGAEARRELTTALPRSACACDCLDITPEKVR